MNVTTPFVIVAAAVLCTNCDKADTPTAPTETTSTVATKHFSGSLGVGASRFYSFTVSQTGTVTVMLASVTAPRTGAALDVELGLGIGRPAGTGCALVHALTTRGLLNAQLQESVVAGIHCIEVRDVGQLTSDVNFAVRFSHP